MSPVPVSPHLFFGVPDPKDEGTIVKVKWSHYRPGVAQRVPDHGTRRGWVVSSMPQPHVTPRKDLVPILQKAGWAPGPVWMGGKSRPHRDSIPDPPACIQSLYQLSYPAHMKALWSTETSATIHQLTTGNIFSNKTVRTSNVTKYTYSSTQCAAVNTQSTLMMEPPQKWVVVRTPWNSTNIKCTHRVVPKTNTGCVCVLGFVYIILWQRTENNADRKGELQNIQIIRPM